MCSILSSLALVFTIALFVSSPAVAQVGGVAGIIKDSTGAVLPGARVELQNGSSAVSDGQWQFTITNIAPGTYTATVNYVGFAPSTTTVTVTAGQTARLNIVLDVASKNDVVIVTAERAHGEAEAINEEKVADNILNVLPSEVITSLPNANIGTR